MKLGFKVALRFLRSNRGQTLLIIVGIAIGVSVQIFIGSLIQGLQKGLVEKTIGFSSQITVTSLTEDKLISNYQGLTEKILAADSEIEDVSPAADFPAFLEYKENSQSILIRGLQLEEADGIYQLKDRIVEGSFPADNNEIMIGIDLKEEYGIGLQDEILITTTNQKEVECKVVGFFDLKVAGLNKGWGITALKAAQEIFEAQDKITSIELQVKEAAVFRTDEIALRISDTLGNKELKVDQWQAQNEQLLSGLQGQSISSLMIQVFVLISVVLGIASVLAITVMQKSKQIGILKAMGIRNVPSGFIFLSEGLILGFFGALLGILLGLGLSYAFTKFALNPDGTPVVQLYISTSFIILSGCIAVTASALAALIPAVKSSKLNPIDIIRNN